MSFPWSRYHDDTKGRSAPPPPPPSPPPPRMRHLRSCDGSCRMTRPIDGICPSRCAYRRTGTRYRIVYADGICGDPYLWEMLLIHIKRGRRLPYTQRPVRVERVMTSIDNRPSFPSTGAIRVERAQAPPETIGELERRICCCSASVDSWECPIHGG